MPISCHFRDRKALLVAYSCKKRYRKYRTVTFSSSVDQDACRRTWARDAFYDDWLRYTGVHPVRPPSDSDQRFSSFTTTLNYFATSIALDAQQAVRRRSIDVPCGADTFKIEQELRVAVIATADVVTWLRTVLGVTMTRSNLCKSTKLILT